MNFLANPWWAGLFALLPIIVVLYLLKLKRRRVVIPSTLLWRRATQDLVANAPFQKLRNNLLMWLQLLLLALLILGFMRPTFRLSDLSGTTLVLLIDQSASMATKEDDGRTRLDIAKEKAREAVNSLSSRDEAIVVSFSDRAAIVQTLTSDKAALRAGIDTIKTLDAGSSLTEATQILQSLTTRVDDQGIRIPREDTRAMLLSDGAVTDLAGLVDVNNLDYVRIGETDDNVGIASVDVRESFGENREFEIFAAVANASAEEREVIVELQRSGKVLDIKSAKVPAGEVRSVVFSSNEEINGLVTLKIDGEDALAADNIARAFVAPPTELRTLIVSNGNFFLEEMLRNDERVTVSVMRPADYAPRDDFDLTIFDGNSPAELRPINSVFVNSLPPIPGFAMAGEPVDRPEIIDWNRVHPLMRFANFENVLVGKAMRYTMPTGAVPLVETVETPLISAYETDTSKTVVIGFDLFKSYWPLDVSFPIFWANVLDYMGRAGASATRPAYRTGDAIALVPPREATAAKVTTPGGRTLDYSFDGVATAFLTETFEAGVYEVEFDKGGTRRLALNIGRESESLIAPRDTLSVEGATIVKASGDVRVNREVWHWFVLAALGFLMLEWGLYCRRTFM